MLARVAQAAVRPGTRGVRAYAVAAAPSKKYADIYNGDFENAKYPVEQYGGSAIFSKLLFKFAETAEGGKYDTYFAEHKKYKEITQKLGPLWPTTEDVWSSGSFQSLNEGFRFVVAWMQRTQNLHEVDSVVRIYGDIVAVQKGEIRGEIIVGKQGADVSAAKASAEAAFKAAHPDKGSKFVYDTTVDPTLEDGYIVEVGGMAFQKLSSKLASKAEEAKAVEVEDKLKLANEKPLELDWRDEGGRFGDIIGAHVSRVHDLKFGL
jgi:hypothetical protein